MHYRKFIIIPLILVTVLSFGQVFKQDTLLFKLYNNFPLNSSVDSIINYCSLNNFIARPNYQDTTKRVYEKELNNYSFFKHPPSKIKNCSFFALNFLPYKNGKPAEALVTTLIVHYGDTSHNSEVTKDYYRIIDNFKREYKKSEVSIIPLEHDESGVSRKFYVSKESDLPILTIDLVFFLEKYPSILVTYIRPWPSTTTQTTPNISIAASGAGR